LDAHNKVMGAILLTGGMHISILEAFKPDKYKNNSLSTMLMVMEQ